MTDLNLKQREIMDRVILSVRNCPQKGDDQTDVPYLRRGNFAIFVQLLAGKKNHDGQYTACLTVTDSLMEKWKISFEELVKAACENSKHLFPGKIYRLEEFVDYSTDKQMRPDGDIAPEVFVLTNNTHFNGASAMFYQPELLNDLSEQYERIVLMPTGTNEIYCIAAEGEDTHGYQQLFDEIIEVMEDEKILSKEVLFYNKDSRELERSNGESFDPELTRLTDEQNFRNARRGR